MSAIPASTYLSNMSIPQVPPRPIKLAQPSSIGMADVPKIPPRPAHRALDPLLNRDNFPRSPLNEVPFAMNHGTKFGNLQHHNDYEANLAASLPPRPPSVSLPSVGQEGNEYADIVYEKPPEAGQSSASALAEPEQTRNVGRDLPLHAPTPSISTSTAKARVAYVTRTDSTQAAAVGIGKAGTHQHDDKSPHSRALRPKVSFSRPESSASTERPDSAQATDSDHGIPEIGQRVPMYPDAGDVQAPSPAPFPPNPPSGNGVFHEGGQQRPGRHHSRTRSGREGFRGPPGSYGMHGHGVQHNDHLEKAWYDKHPDALVREENCGQYGPGIGGGRAEWALSSEDLNKIVRDTARRGSGFGTAASIDGLPNEQIGYIASEEYTSRINSPPAASYQNKAHSNHSQTHVESPLRKASFPVDVDGKAAFDDAKDTHGMANLRLDSALESETEDDEIHVDAPAYRTSKYTGNGYDPPTEDLGPFGGNTDAEGGWIQETGYGVPILASDEVAKEPGSEYLQPAVSPPQERRGSTHYAGMDSDAPPSYQSGYRIHSRPDSASNSRPSSRPGSIHGLLPGLTRFTSHDEREDMHTPLEDVDEYEPLFPEDDGKGSGSLLTAEKKNRQENLKRRFPSQDIWEDTPNSLQLQTTVETPEPMEEQDSSITKEKGEASTLFETPETEAKRQGKSDGGEMATSSTKDQPLSKSHWKPHLREEMKKPELKRRFPSQDIWEDSPDSAHLETTVEEPQIEEPRSPPGEKVDTSEAADQGERRDKSFGSESIGEEGIVSEGITSQRAGVDQRSLASETSASSADAGSQAIPSVPARPARRLRQGLPANNTSNSPKISTESSLSPNDSKTVSPSETRKPPIVPDRPKPQIPARPARSTPRDASDMTPLSKTTSASSTGSVGAKGGDASGVISPPAPPKSKPMVPSRPVGSKIASLKAGFLSDLDKRLQIGPQAPKASEKIVAAEPEKEVEEEKAPLVDARKGRAKGPPRRKPAGAVAGAGAGAAAMPLAITTAEENEDVVKEIRSNWGIQEAWTVWQTEDDGSINAVHAAGGDSRTPIQKENENDGGSRSPPEPVPSSDSMSARDTPTSSRDETVGAATFDDLSFTAGHGTGTGTVAAATAGMIDPSKEEISDPPLPLDSVGVVGEAKNEEAGNAEEKEVIRSGGGGGGAGESTKKSPVDLDMKS